jgi:hypothetical protein
VKVFGRNPADPALTTVVQVHKRFADNPLSDRLSDLADDFPYTFNDLAGLSPAENSGRGSVPHAASPFCSPATSANAICSAASATRADVHRPANQIETAEWLIASWSAIR